LWRVKDVVKNDAEALILMVTAVLMDGTTSSNVRVVPGEERPVELPLIIFASADCIDSEAPIPMQAAAQRDNNLCCHDDFMIIPTVAK
jgi:hypothetical protein